MKNQILIIVIIAAILSSCAAIKSKSEIIGEFKGKTPSAGSFVPSGEVLLSLLQEGTFKLQYLEDPGFRSIGYSGTE